MQRCSRERSWLPRSIEVCPPPPVGSGTTCWEKGDDETRNPGLKETLGSGSRYSSLCVLDAFTAIEQAAAEFGIETLIDTMIRIAACESLLQPAIVGRGDPADEDCSNGTRNRPATGGAPPARRSTPGRTTKPKPATAPTPPGTQARIGPTPTTRPGWPPGRSEPSPAVGRRPGSAKDATMTTAMRFSP